MNITYRQATNLDIDVVTNLLLQLFTDHDPHSLRAENELLLEDKDAAIFLAFDRAEAVGIAHVAMRFEYVEGVDSSSCGYLEAIYVRDTYRNTGIAQQLVLHCEAWTLAHKSNILASDCEVQNLASAHFHEHIGFKEVSRNIHFTKDIKR